MKTNWPVLGAILLAAINLAAASSGTQERSAATTATQEKTKGTDVAESPQESDDPAQQEIVEDFSSLSEAEALAKVESLAKQFDEDLDAFRTKFQAASKEERAQLRSGMPKPEKYVEKFQKLAELHPQTDVEAKACVWIVQHQRGGPTYEWALTALVDHHADSAELKPIVMTMQYQPPSQRTSDFFQKLRANSTQRDLGAIATYAYLQYQKRAGEVKNALAEDEDSAKSYEQAYGKAQVDFLQQMEPLSDEAMLAELEKLNAEFGDVMLTAERSLASIIEGDLFEAKFLRIGKEVPDIEGEDIDGTAFKLSDYRGKVVMLDFWGDW